MGYCLTMNAGFSEGQGWNICINIGWIFDDVDRCHLRLYRKYLLLETAGKEDFQLERKVAWIHGFYLSLWSLMKMVVVKDAKGWIFLFVNK